MRTILLLSILFQLSCKSPMLLEQRFAYEISNYGLENVDTLVDIGCGYATTARFISGKFPNLHFILEDLPTDTWGNDLKIALAKNVRNTPLAPYFGSNSTIIFGSNDSIPLPGGQYKKVLCRITLHEFANREKMVSELVRILSPTGTLVIVERVSSRAGERDKHCKKLYLTREEIIQSFHDLNLAAAIPLKPASENGFVFKFRKKPASAKVSPIME